MDGYPNAYVAHNIPLISTLGLGNPSKDAEGPRGPAIRIKSEISAIETDDAQLLAKYLKDCDADCLTWNKREHEGRTRFRVKICSRDYLLPGRHCPLSASSLKSVESQGGGSNPKPILHSCLSPLNPESPIFPDGLLLPTWLEKHQEVIPSAFISFYIFSHDPKLSTIQDNQLKTDINVIKSTLAETGVRSRLIVVLLSQKLHGHPSQAEERLTNIRRATGLDPKTSLFVLPFQSHPSEIKAFVGSLLTDIHPSCIEYYRDLSKHTRRKKNRGVIPPPTVRPTLTSQTLSAQGWSLRYDFKLGIFAEFRQEMDAAVRSFESGYDVLLGPEGLETIANWSPRWNEARLLSDVFVIRMLRCLLWNGNSIAAVRRWQVHRDRIRDFVDRRGKGSSNYGWEAWEARWAVVMAETIQIASMAEFTPSLLMTYLPAEKTNPVGERIQPWEYLHHPGYYFCAASRHLAGRRTLALKIPEEDKMPPGSAPASQIASKAYTYDTYLCPEPHIEANEVDHARLIIDILSKAVVEFDLRGQRRKVEEIRMQIAKENVRREAWNDALQILRSLWQKMTYRPEGWFTIVEEVGWALRNVAVVAGDGHSIVSVDWELLHKSFTKRPDWHYDISRSLEGVNVEVKPTVVLSDQEVLSFLSATFSFEQSEAKVGEACRSQLSIASSALAGSTAVKIAEVRIEFEGNMKSIILRHRDISTKEAEDTRLRSVSLEDGLQSMNKAQPRAGNEFEASFIGETNLTLCPSSSIVFEFTTIPKEAGHAKALSATFEVAPNDFILQYVHTFRTTYLPSVWWVERHLKKKIVRDSASSITILPKPPKLELRFVQHELEHYTNEEVRLRLEVLNGEEVDSIVNLTIEGTNAPLIKLGLATGSETELVDSSLELTLGTLAPGSITVLDLYINAVEIPLTYDIKITGTYCLVSELDISLSVSKLLRLQIVDPFEANYEFAPRIHADPWPSFFDCDDPKDEGEPQGLRQKWCLTARYASFATDELIVDDINIEIIGVNGGVQCSTKKLQPMPAGGLLVKPGDIEEIQFEILSEKLSLDDRGISMLDCSLAIEWRRSIPHSPPHTMKLAVPRLLVSSTEPRVLLTSSHSNTIASMIHFDVTIENPSSHFLTFSLVMEPSENFAFSGMKQAVLQLVPLSRRTIRFRLLPCVVEDWLGPVNCVIRDRYFQKVLKVTPTEGMKLEKEGLFIWVPPFMEEA